MAVAKRVIQINNDIRNALTPSGLEFTRTKIFLGENYSKIYTISKYPNTLPQGWAATITNLASAVTCQLFEPCDNGILITDLSKSVARYRGIADSTRDALERQRAEKSAEDAEKLMWRIDENGEVVGYMSNIIMISARDEVLLEKACRSFESTVATLNCKSRLLVNQQDVAFKAVSPCNTPSEELLRTARRNVPISTYIEGFPFASNSFSDKEGYPLGRNTKNGLVVVNPWERGGDRTNSNIIVLGVAGVGKSATIKHLMISEFMMGTINVVIDPESEARQEVA